MLNNDLEQVGPTVARDVSKASGGMALEWFGKMPAT